MRRGATDSPRSATRPRRAQNETGTGSGTGTRRGKIVAVGDPEDGFDEARLAEAILAQARAFEEEESTAPAAAAMRAGEGGSVDARCS